MTVATATSQSPFDQPSTIFEPSTFLGGEVVADFDGDSIPDIIKDAPGAGLLFYRGQGNGVFSEPTELLPPGSINTVNDATVGDTDGDGDLDLIVTSVTSGNPNARLVNNGSGQFLLVDLNLQGGPYRPARLADINGDSVLDLVTFMQTPLGRDVLWFDGQASGFTGPPMPIVSIPGFKVFRLADVDGDGAIDLTTSANNGGLRVAFGLGGGTFDGLAPLPGAASLAVHPVSLVDMDGDGAMELFSARPNGLKYYRALGPRTYAAPVTLATSLFETNVSRASDLDGDGDLDLLHISYASSGLGGSSRDTTAFLQTAPGVFVAAPITSAANPQIASLRDLNGDGVDDLIFANVRGLRWQAGGQGASAGFFGPVQFAFQDMTSATVHELGDLDSDGDTDVIITSGLEAKVGWLENLGGGEFGRPTVLFDAPQEVIMIRPVDFDSDGDLDLITVTRALPPASTNHELTVYVNDGAGGFSPASPPTQFDSPVVFEVDVDDFDADGDIDVGLVFRAPLAFDAVGALFLGDGAGNFVRASDAIPASENAQVAKIGDLNADGLPDFVFASPRNSTARSLFVALNLGGGTFAPPVLQGPVGNATELGLVDINQDGAQDAVLSTQGNLVAYFGDNAGATTGSALIGGPFHSSLGFADLDLDGDPDIYSPNAADFFGAQWSRQNATGSFGAEQSLFAIDSFAREVTKLADMDGDGDPDAVVLGDRASSFTPIRLYLNGSLSDIGENFCALQVINSTGMQGQMTAYGSEDITVNAAELRATNLPPAQFGLFVGSQSHGSPLPVPGSAGLLCLTGAIGRYQGPGQVQSSGAEGAITLDLDLQNLSVPNGTVAGMIGESWSFQVWHRDSGTSNLTTGVSITLR